MIRPAKPQDVKAIVRMGRKALDAAGYKGLFVDPDKLLAEAKECVSSARHFSWVSELDGEVVASVVGRVDPFMWFKGQQLSIVQFYTEAPGEGVKLLRQLRKWYIGRAGIRAITFVFEGNADPRVQKLIDRIFGTTIAFPVSMGVKEAACPRWLKASKRA